MTKRNRIDVDVSAAVTAIVDSIGQLERRMTHLENLIRTQQEMVRLLGVAVDGHNRLFEVIGGGTVNASPKAATVN